MGRRGPWRNLDESILGPITWLDDDRILSPYILSRLHALLAFGWVVQNARNYLIYQNVVSQFLPLTGYYDFCRRVFVHIREVGYSAAVPLIQSDVALFVSWGFSAEILRSLALLQGIEIPP